MVFVIFVIYSVCYTPTVRSTGKTLEFIKTILSTWKGKSRMLSGQRRLESFGNAEKRAPVRLGKVPYL